MHEDAGSSVAQLRSHHSPRVEEPIILDGGVRDEARAPLGKWMSREISRAPSP